MLTVPRTKLSTITTVTPAHGGLVLGKQLIDQFSDNLRIVELAEVFRMQKTVFGHHDPSTKENVAYIEKLFFLRINR